MKKNTQYFFSWNDSNYFLVKNPVKEIGLQKVVLFPRNWALLTLHGKVSLQTLQVDDE